MKSWHTTCVIATLLYGNVFSIPFVRQSQSDHLSANNGDSNSKVATNDTMIREFPFSLRSHPYDQNDAMPANDAKTSFIDPIPSEQNFRISVSELELPHSDEDDNPEMILRRINKSDNNNMLITTGPHPEMSQEKPSNEPQETSSNEPQETSSNKPQETPSNEQPVIPLIIMYAIKASVVVLFISLLIILIMICYIINTTPKEISSDMCLGDDITCIAPRKSRRSTATKKSDNYSSDEDSEQTVDLMDKGSGCSSRKGSCMIRLKTMRR